LMSVLMTKMVADWFVGKELATAMAIFFNSWPVGIAMTLLVLPQIGVAYDAATVNLAVAGFVAVGLAVLAIAYRAPSASTGVAGASGRLTFQAAMGVVCAGAIWGL